VCFNFLQGIYTVLRPLHFPCKVSGLVSYNYLADRRTKRANLKFGYLNYMFIVIWLILYKAGISVQILDAYSVDMDSQTLFSFVLYIIYYRFILYNIFFK